MDDEREKAVTEKVKDIKSRKDAGEDVTQAMERVYFENLNFVRLVARGFLKIQEMDDMLQEGFFAFVSAVDYFDPDRGCSFLTVYKMYLKTTFARMKGAPVYIPYTVRDSVRRYKKLTDGYIKQYGVEPLDLYYFREGFTQAELDNVRLVMAQEHMGDIDSPISGTDGCFLGDVLSDRNATSPEEDAIQAVYEEEIKGVWSHVDTLTTEQQADAIRQVIIAGRKTTEPELGQIYRAGMSRLRNHYRVFLQYLDDGKRYSGGLKGNGVQRFQTTRTSSTERTALQLVKNEKRR